MSTLKPLLARLARLEAISAIQALKARYAALADAKYTAELLRVDDVRMSEVAWQQVQCFTEDAIWYGGEFGGDLHGHAALHDWFKRSPWRYATHLYASPELALHDDHAEGRWRLWQLALPQADDGAVLLTANTCETYRRTHEGTWLIASMRFENVQLMQASHSTHPLVRRLSDLPGAFAR